jgi:soluble lytic murein transglycosylase-like protein
MFLNALITLLLGAFILFGGPIPLTYPFDQPEKSPPEASGRSKNFVSAKIPDADPQEKKEISPFPDRSAKRERSLFPIIQRVCLRYNIDPALVKAIIMAESEYNPKAVSVKGAKGLMQLMPVTARNLGVEDAFNAEQNIHAGVRHFKFLLKQFDGDVKLALAAYNAGSRNVKRYNAIPPFKETKRYVKKVFRYYHFYKER